MKKSGIIALGILAVLVVWFIYGNQQQQIEPPTNARLDTPSLLQKVQAEFFSSQLMNREIKISAVTAANRSIDIKAEVKARVVEITQTRGSFVKKGDVLIKLDSRDWPAKVTEAQQLLRQRKLETDNARQLFKRDLLSKAQLAARESELASAKAKLAVAKQNLAATTITAPFAGVVDQRYVELGDLVKDSQPLIKIVDIDPMIIKGNVAELNIDDVETGDIAYAILPNGRKLKGRVRYIAQQADENTRSYPIEVEINNKQTDISVGLTAALYIPQPPVNSYFISPALLQLSDSGQLSVKTLSADNRVTITPVKLLKAATDGIYIYGEEKELKLITVGHGFVNAGQQVQPVFASTNAGE